MARLFYADGGVTDWHPLDNCAPPDVFPVTWDGPHCGLRLADGFRTLALLPIHMRPRAYAQWWPTYAYDWADLLAQQCLAQRVEQARVDGDLRVFNQEYARRRRAAKQAHRRFMTYNEAVGRLRAELAKAAAGGAINRALLERVFGGS